MHGAATGDFLRCLYLLNHSFPTRDFIQPLAHLMLKYSLSYSTIQILLEGLAGHCDTVSGSVSPSYWEII